MHIMERTNVYLDDRQLAALRRLGDQRDTAVASLIREAIDAWLVGQGVRMIEEREWDRRFAALLDRRERIADKKGFDPDRVERDVTRAVTEVRRKPASRR